MPVIKLRRLRQVAGLVSLAAALVLIGAASTGAQPLPRVEGPLTIDQAVELAREKSLRVKASDADSRTMDSMRREALAPFWPQASANGYYNSQAQSPNVYTSAGNTMARNYQVFNANENRDGNLTLMYSLFSGGRDY
jgi:outer membrane protein TolC